MESATGVLMAGNFRGRMPVKYVNTTEGSW